MSQLLLLLPSDLTRPTVKSLLFTILVVVPSISHYLKSQEESSKLKLLMEILHSEEKILIFCSNNTSLENSRNNMEWTLLVTNSLYRE
jgi:superfamily II DNA/RNA helicase